MSQAQQVREQSYVWQAPRPMRLAVAGVCVALLLMSAYVLIVYGYLAVIGVGLVVALVTWTWWVVLRPRLSAGPEGVRVVSARTPVQVAWTEIRSCDATPQGLKIMLSGGREVLARYPQQPARPVPGTTEAEATAVYLAQRAAWARKPSGPPPRYVAPPPPPPGR